MQEVIFDMQQSRFQDALKVINEVLTIYTNINDEVDPEALEILKYKVNICVHLKNAQELANTLDKIVVLSPTDAKAWLDRGIAYLQLKNVPWAKGSLTKATELDPGNAAAWLNLGVVMADTGELAEAINCFDKVLEIDPGNQRVIQAKQKVVEAARQQGIEL